MTSPADLGVAEAARLLASRKLSSRELVDACLARIDALDGPHSRDGSPDAINAWVRVYADDARAAAAEADELRSKGTEVSPLAGIPIGLKDIFAVAGKPLTASSRVPIETPSQDSFVWAQLQAAGMVLLGHLHTHEFADGTTTDQVGNPWNRALTAGGSSGGSAAALAARMVPAATGSDTAGSLRIPSALCGTSTIKATHGLVPIDGIIPLAYTFDHAGPMARTLEDCALLLNPMTAWSQAPAPPPADSERPLRGVRIARSPRTASVTLDDDVAAGYDAACALCAELGAEVLDDPAPPGLELDQVRPMLLALISETLAHHERFRAHRDLLRPATRDTLETAERVALSAADYVAIQLRRREDAALWESWLAERSVHAVIEPTVPIVAKPRGDGSAAELPPEHAAYLSLTQYWNWTGMPVVTLPAGVGAASGLPVSVSLAGGAGTEWPLLHIGMALQHRLGVPSPPV